MATPSLEEYLEFASNLADKAGKVLTEGFYGDKKVEQKNNQSWDLVTDYDRKVEKLIKDAIQERYPHHKMIGEEESSESNKELELTDTETWIVDPIDGTYNYAHGFPFTCVSIALAIAGTVQVGVVYNPLTKHKFSAVKGKGATLNGKSIHVSQHPRLKDSLVSFEFSLVKYPPLRERQTKRSVAVACEANGVRILGSAALSLCFVASGGIDLFYHEYLKPWDLAAGSLIVQEAGGFTCHINGDPYNVMRRDILAAANEDIANDTLAIFKQYP